MPSIQSQFRQSQFWRWQFWAFRTTLLRGLARVPILPLAAGLWLGCAFPAPSPGWLVLPALCGLLIRSPAPTGPGQILLGLLLGSLLVRGSVPTLCPDPGEGRSTQWIGRVVSIEPSRNERTSLVLDLLSGHRAAREVALRCRVLVSSGRRLPEVLAGDIVWLPAVDLEPPVHLINPGSGDTAAALTAQGIERVGSLADGAGVLTLDRAALPMRWLARWRSIADARINSLPAGDARELVRALGLGERSAMTTALGDALRDSGLRHLMTLGLLYLSLWTAVFTSPITALWSRSERLALWLPARRAAALTTLPIPCLYGALGKWSDRRTRHGGRVDGGAGRSLRAPRRAPAASLLARAGCLAMHRASRGRPARAGLVAGGADRDLGAGRPGSSCD